MITMQGLQRRLAPTGVFRQDGKASMLNAGQNLRKRGSRVSLSWTFRLTWRNSPIIFAESRQTDKKNLCLQWRSGIFEQYGVPYLL
jgi:hypothetical protein